MLLAVRAIGAMSLVRGQHRAEKGLAGYAGTSGPSSCLSRRSSCLRPRRRRHDQARVPRVTSAQPMTIAATITMNSGAWIVQPKISTVVSLEFCATRTMTMITNRIQRISAGVNLGRHRFSAIGVAQQTVRRELLVPQSGQNLKLPKKLGVNSGEVEAALALHALPQVW